MNSVSVNTMVSHIRSILDENETNTELNGVNGVRQLTLEDVIKNHLISGVDAVTMLAPSDLLEATASTFATTDKKLIIPDEALKVIWFKANGWNRSVTELHDPTEQLYKLAKHGRVGSVCNANSPVGFLQAEAFNPYGSEVLNFGGEVDTLPTTPTLNKVYYKKSDKHSYKCTKEKTSDGYKYISYDSSYEVVDDDILSFLNELEDVGDVIQMDINDDTYYVTMLYDEDNVCYMYSTCAEDGELDSNSETLCVDEDGAIYLNRDDIEFLIREVKYIAATYQDLGELPTNKYTANVIECFPQPSGSTSPYGWIQYAQKTRITNNNINVSDKVYEACCLYIAGLVCDSMGWAKNRDYKSDAFLRLGVNMQTPEQNVNG